MNCQKADYTKANVPLCIYYVRNVRAEIISPYQKGGLVFLVWLNKTGF
ncbi:MAG: hypothetical protein ACI4QC_09185 [Thermoguttaceae bacterium]